jgi:hypothetical protein
MAGMQRVTPAMFGVVVLAAFLAWPGTAPHADTITFMSMDKVHHISWGQAFGVFDHWEPVQAQGVRPFSILLIKSYLSLFGVDIPPPGWVLWLTGAFGLVCFALAARMWLQAIGLRRFATPVMFTTMLMGPQLFVAWFLPELDTFGNAATLVACAGLATEGEMSRRRWGWTLAAAAFAFLLKESSALIMFGFLGAGVLGHALTGRRLAAMRHARVLAGGLVLWMALAWSLLGSGESYYASQPLVMRLKYVVHNVEQVLFICGFVGPIALISLAARGGRFATWTPAVGVVLLLALPLVSFYDHFETYYASPPEVPMVLGAMMLLALVIAGWRLRATPGVTLVALTVCFVLGGFGAAAILSPSAREDLATRLFFGLAPGLHALVFEGFRVAWEDAKTMSRPSGGHVARAGIKACVLTFLWFTTVSGVNHIIDWPRYHGLEHEGKTALAAEDLAGANVLYNHFGQLLDPPVLRAMGATTLNEDTQLLLVGDWFQDRWLPRLAWPREIDLEMAYLGGTPTLVYWYGTRSTMPEAAKALENDYSWTHGMQGGLFEVPQYLGRNHPEDNRHTVFTAGPTPLERLLEERGEVRWKGSVDTWRLPVLLTEVPRRLAMGIPLIETYRHEAKVVRLTKRR